jgi:hypothetical protein
MDAQNSVNDVWYRLGFLSLADMTTGTPWVTQTELFDWADEAAKRLAYECQLFATYDTSMTVVAGTSVYNLPATHVFTLLAAVGGRLLRMTSVRDLWALDATWPATTGSPLRCSLDAGSVGTITIYPTPVDGGTLAQVSQEFPPALAVGASQLAVPTVLQDYVSYACLAGARGKESENADQALSQHFKQRMDLYEQVIQHLWGPGQ